MNEIDTYHILIFMLMVFGLSCIIAHIRTYQSLYHSLTNRGLAGDDFAPHWISKISSFGCMGYLTRIKQEIGIDKLNPSETSQFRTAVLSYYVGTLAAFVAVCLFFWRIYGGVELIPN